MIVVDSSIALQWVLPEAGTDMAVGLLGRPDLIAPDILLIESANVLAKKVRAGDLTTEVARTGLRIIHDALRTTVNSAELADTTLGLSVDLAHPAYDCCFFACALANGASLATRDRPFINRLIARGHGSRLHLGRTSHERSCRLFQYAGANAR